MSRAKLCSGGRATDGNNLEFNRRLWWAFTESQGNHILGLHKDQCGWQTEGSYYSHSISCQWGCPRISVPCWHPHFNKSLRNWRRSAGVKTRQSGPG